MNAAARGVPSGGMSRTSISPETRRRRWFRGPSRTLAPVRLRLWDGGRGRDIERQRQADEARAATRATTAKLKEAAATRARRAAGQPLQSEAEVVRAKEAEVEAGGATLALDADNAQISVRRSR